MESARRFLAGMIGVCFSSLALAQFDPAEPSGWYLAGLRGRNELILGSLDPRQVAGLAIGYARPERRLRLAGNRAQLAIEMHDLDSRRVTYGNRTPSETTAVGILAIGRWRWRSGSHFPLYGEIGWGLQYTNRKTRDLPSRLNSTPVFGIGFRFIKGRELAAIGLRLLHVSNAGLLGKNSGQNLLMVVLMVPI